MSQSHVPDALMERFIEGDVEELLAVEIARHLDACPRCANRANNLEPLSTLFACVDDPVVPIGLVSDVLAAFDAPARPGPEPAIAAGLLALALVALVVGGSPGELAVGALKVALALGSAGKALSSAGLAVFPFVPVLAALALLGSTLLARSLELSRRSA